MGAKGEKNMAVNVFRDSTYARKHSTLWDGTETPADFDNRTVLLEIDSGIWYNYYAETVALTGWYDSDGGTK